MTVVNPPAGSISFVVTARLYSSNYVDRLLKVLESVKRPDDEVIFLVSEDHPETATFRPDWLRVARFPDASIFQLRAQIPVVTKREWVILLEDHVMIEPGAVGAIRALIREQPDLDIIPFTARNLTSTDQWGWAIFLFTFALVWGPLDHPPPFAFVTSAIVKRAHLGSAPLEDGEWESRAIPQIFETGKHAFSNDIFVDHIKPKTAVEAVINIYYNSRADAWLQHRLGETRLKIIRDGWYNVIRRPRRLMRAIGARKHDLPTGTRARLHILGVTHLIGYILGITLGGQQAAHELDRD